MALAEGKQDPTEATAVPVGGGALGTATVTASGRTGGDPAGRLRRRVGGAAGHALSAPPVDPALHVSEAQVLWRALRRSPMIFNYAFFLSISILGCTSSPVLFALCNMDYYRMPGGMMVLGALRVGSPGARRPPSGHANLTAV
eukprot:914945-Rhodomonas_salina.1